MNPARPLYRTAEFRMIDVAPGARELMPGVQVLTLEAELPEGGVAPADAVWAEAHARWNGASRAEVRADPRVTAYRELSRRLGSHPDKQPPSVQALIDRGLRGKPLGAWPRINPAVDAVNAAAVHTRVALGLFDRDQLAGRVRLRLADGTEEFHAIGADQPVVLEAGRPVLADDERVLSLFAHRDGVRQAVTARTRRVLLLACAVPGVSEDGCRDALLEAAGLLSATG
ncbi:phenylalanine--tRNA ligase beta subunit-related protein [Streptomyces sp. DH41]|uniref:phenylalanine--tRNA ligase beta subunit-related protein n=1 Tax=Streptomyces sp. DH41 TaxID=3040125 RepID=UPI002442E6AB|nr:phenylalanine--tRNA ligase beta subunit-related protein [Streptomyces sp. DH41]MDG9722047.1 phenylalanine--tRNA ligase beta subunit-related protein [Streptomyces sp. DH41]